MASIARTSTEENGKRIKLTAGVLRVSARNILSGPQNIKPPKPRLTHVHMLLLGTASSKWEINVASTLFSRYHSSKEHAQENPESSKSCDNRAGQFCDTLSERRCVNQAHPSIHPSGHVLAFYGECDARVDPDVHKALLFLCDVSTLQGAEHWKAPADLAVFHFFRVVFPAAKTPSTGGLTSQGQPGSTQRFTPSQHQENIGCTVPDPALSRHPSTSTPLLGTVDREDAQTDELQPIPAFPPVCGGSLTPHWRPP
ncbi:hypothetical protein CIHG_04862 [Coccidioides immitis H538.4]|uniref:Uncharacterized protein n=3 Tax=Coccidioides immitis TaxID=5501 RepID=A0A0J8QQI3_COCIT|nr:hypothetical protein CIRG_05373 [Coccidioides immitis RMSCC 2394]KMU74425.1 hypothetical protein CISG_04496 [Coccidioides immitis RMSCC 3703]KMU86923.1 hypothetical protein CIHG_04862 [Coccidioides immitis H538.4]